MSRRVRIEYPGAIYHIMNRGNRHEPVFNNHDDYRSFLSTLEDACRKTEWHIHAYCLLPDHFHLALETPRPNLVTGMKWLLGTYTVRFNLRHGMMGHLFAGRYKALPVSGREGYLAALADYIHLSPARANLLTRDEPLRDYAWSSFPGYAEPLANGPDWLRTDRVLGDSGISGESATGGRDYERRVQQARSRESTELTKRIEGNWYLGDDDFKKELLARVGEKAGAFHYGPELSQRDEELARELLHLMIEEKGLTLEKLESMPKGHPEKIQLAKRMRSETTMTIRWIAEHLHMGSRTYLVHLLYWDGKEKPKPEPRKSGRRKTALARRRVRKNTTQAPKPGDQDAPVDDRMGSVEGFDHSVLWTESLDPRFD